jgi:hypothetical protein
MPFIAAVKEAFTLKLAVAGIAGAGKTFTSLELANMLSNGERFAVIDTENRKARIYADHFQFDVLDLDVFTLGSYTKAFKEAEAAGYRVLVIDGLSQLWEGKNGLKDLAEQIARRDRITTFSAWQQVNNLLADFIKMLLDSRMHIICTLRSKIDYSTDTNKDGKLQCRRSGLAPIFKENFEYEFPVYIEMDHEHRATFYKSMCPELDKKVLSMADESEAKRLVSVLRRWAQGAPRQPLPAVQASAQPTQEPLLTSMPGPDEPVTESQVVSLSRLYQRLERAEPETPPANYGAAKELIAQLSQEYRQSRTKSAS